MKQIKQLFSDSKNFLIIMGVIFAANLAFSKSCESFYRESIKTKELNRNIRKALEELRKKDDIPGITYVVYNEKGVLFKNSIGKETSTQQPLNAEKSLYRIASISKLFTTLAVSQLIEKGQLTLETSLMDLDQVDFVKYLKQHETKDRLKQWEKIKIHHLMSHQSGLSKDIPGALAFFNKESVAGNTYPSFKEFYKGLTSVEFIYEPGTIPPGMKYSNLGMNILARVVEAYNTQHQSFPDYVKENILKPLHMNNTYYDLPFGQRTELVTGHTAIIDGKRQTVPKAYRVGSYDGSIGVASSAVDLAKLGMELLRLTHGESKLLKQESTMHHFLTLKSPLTATMSWASGPLWQVLPGKTVEDPLWVGHTGTGHSERSTLIVSPELGMGVVVFFSTPDANREKYVAKILEVTTQAQGAESLISEKEMNTFSKQLVEDSRAFLKKVKSYAPNLPPSTNTKEQLARFTGSYFADIVGTQKITLSEDGYLLFFGNKLIVENLEQGKFRVVGSGGLLFNAEPVVFEFDSKGNVIGLRIAQVKKFAKVGEAP